MALQCASRSSEAVLVRYHDPFAFVISQAVFSCGSSRSSKYTCVRKQAWLYAGTILTLLVRTELESALAWERKRPLSTQSPNSVPRSKYVSGSYAGQAALTRPLDPRFSTRASHHARESRFDDACRYQPSRQTPLESRVPRWMRQLPGSPA